MSVTRTCNKPLAYIREHSPSLTIARATLLPFECLICSESAGERDGQPFFTVAVMDPTLGMPVEFTVTAESVEATLIAVPGDEEQVVVDEWPTTLAALWDYLRQLPRPAHAFRRRPKN
jgi:hypothetical protein